MAHRFIQIVRAAVAAVVLGTFLAAVLSAQKAPEKKKHIPRTVWNFDGGIFMETDGSLNEHTCFRLAGRVFAKDFFDNLKRIDDDQGTTFVREKETLTEFPAQLSVIFVIHDLPCPSQIHDMRGREYLTREMVSKLKLSLFWKKGVDLRPIDDFKIDFFDVRRILPYAKDLANELPERLEWDYELEVPSAGVPLTDSLVLMVRREDGRIAARVAARL